MQLVELREYAARRGWNVVEEYVDHVSGAKESRPAVNKLMNDARQRKWDIVAVWKLDRYGRSVRHVVVALSELEALGIAFFSLKDNLDLSTPSGRLMFQIIAAMAEFERSLIQERVRAGLRNAKLKGKNLGRPPLALDRPPSGRGRIYPRNFGATGSIDRNGPQGTSAVLPWPGVLRQRLFSRITIPTAPIAGYLAVSVDALYPVRFNGAHVPTPDS